MAKAAYRVICPIVHIPLTYPCFNLRTSGWICNKNENKCSALKDIQALHLFSYVSDQIQILYPYTTQHLQNGMI